MAFLFFSLFLWQFELNFQIPTKQKSTYYYLKKMRMTLSFAKFIHSHKLTRFNQVSIHI